MNLNIFMSPIMLPLYQNFTTFLCLICIFIPTFIFSCAKTMPLSMMMILRPAQFDVLFLENYYTSWTDRYCPLLDRVIALLMKKVDIDPYAWVYKWRKDRKSRKMHDEDYFHIKVIWTLNQRGRLIVVHCIVVTKLANARCGHDG